MIGVNREEKFSEGVLTGALTQLLVCITLESQIGKEIFDAYKRAPFEEMFAIIQGLTINF